MDRRRFIALASTALPLIAVAQTPQKPPPPPPIPDEEVKEFVRVGHNDLAAVQRMLQDRPGLLNASWDLGGGDHETALEGAGHVGDRDIAEFLIGQGARPNIFVLTMLGHTEVVKALLTAYPQLLRSRGPHGLTLLHHAQRGGANAAGLVEHLTQLGLTETKLPLP